MTRTSLTNAMAPRSVALIGASERPGSLGALVLSNMLNGGFEGAIYPVNPRYAELGGLTCAARVADLPAVPDLCVIATPAHTIPDLIAEIGRAGGRAVVIITAGIGNEDQLRQRMLTAAAEHDVRIIGPNTIGILAPLVGLNASFTHIPARSGSLALLSQSGAIISSVIDWAESERIGFSQVVSLGDMADLNVSDFLTVLADDPNTSAILMYLESIPDAPRFIAAAQTAARRKPVLAIKPGRHEAAARAAQTHTGALAGADAVVDAALRRAGVIRVVHLEDLFSAAEICARFEPLQRARVGIVTNGGGAGVLAIDELIDRGCEIAELAPDTLRKLDAALPDNWSHANPVDIIGDAKAERYIAAMQAVAADPGVDVVLAMNCPTALASPAEAAGGVVSIVEGGLINGKPVLATWLGEHAASSARDLLNGAGVATVNTPAKAADAVKLLTRWHRTIDHLFETGSPDREYSDDHDAASIVLAKAAADQRTMLTEPEAKAVLSAYGIAVPHTLTVSKIAEVGPAAQKLLDEGQKIAVKMLSSTLTHKSDMGGVVLDLVTAAAAHQAAVEVAARLEARGVLSELEGFSVQEMIIRPKAEELLVGVTTDPVFGPVMMFGAGGVSVEVVRDTTMELLPVDLRRAQGMIGRTRISALLAGYRDRPAADQRAIIGVLTAVSRLVKDFPQITAIDINPLLADANGVVALDARIELTSITDAR